MKREDYEVFKAKLIEHLTNISGEDYDTVYYYIDEYDFDPTNKQMVSYVADIIMTYSSLRRPDRYTVAYGLEDLDDPKCLASMFILDVGGGMDFADVTCGKKKSQTKVLYKDILRREQPPSLTKYSAENSVPKNVLDIAKERERREKKSIESSGITYIPNADKLLAIIKEYLTDKPIDGASATRYISKPRADWSMDWSDPLNWVMVILLIYSLLDAFL